MILNITESFTKPLIRKLAKPRNERPRPRRTNPSNQLRLPRRSRNESRKRSTQSPTTTFSRARQMPRPAPRKRLQSRSRKGYRPRNRRSTNTSVRRRRASLRRLTRASSCHSKKNDKNWPKLNELAPRFRSCRHPRKQHVFFRGSSNPLSKSGEPATKTAYC